MNTPADNTKSLFALLKNGKALFTSHEATKFYPKVLEFLGNLSDSTKTTMEIFYCHQMDEEKTQEVISKENYKEIAFKSVSTDDGLRAPHVFLAKNLNPHNKDWTNIPKGSYCYESLRPVSTPGTNVPPRLKMHNICPYHITKNFNGVDVPWCAYLEEGGTEGTLKYGQTKEEAEIEHQKLLEHFGSEEEMDKALPHLLLFDQIKICGVNDWEEISDDV